MDMAVMMRGVTKRFGSVAANDLSLIHISQRMQAGHGEERR